MNDDLFFALDTMISRTEDVRECYCEQDNPICRVLNLEGQYRASGRQGAKVARTVVDTLVERGWVRKARDYHWAARPDLTHHAYRITDAGYTAYNEELGWRIAYHAQTGD